MHLTVIAVELRVEAGDNIPSALERAGVKLLHGRALSRGLVLALVRLLWNAAGVADGAHVEHGGEAGVVQVAAADLTSLLVVAAVALAEADEVLCEARNEVRVRERRSIEIRARGVEAAPADRAAGGA
jgi:hypothetical protein